MLNRITAFAHTICKQIHILFNDDFNQIERLIINKIMQNTLRGRKAPIIAAVCGASASGKGHIVEEVEKLLQKNKYTTQTISTDNYYIGITRMIFDPILKELHLTKEQQRHITDTLRPQVSERPFDNKINNDILQHFHELLEQTGCTYTWGLLREKTMRNAKPENLDFDSVSAIDMEQLEADIKDLQHGKPIPVRTYDMKCSEPKPSAANALLSPTDVVLIEGIYAFEREVIAHAHVKVFIDVPFENLLARRFQRDIAGKRTPFSPTLLLKILLTKVLPEYRKHIAPREKYADIICHNALTPREAFETTEHHIQMKFAISARDKEYLLSLLTTKATLKKDLVQHDYFLQAEGAAMPDIRIRENAQYGSKPKLFSIATLGHGLFESGIPGININQSQYLIPPKGFVNSHEYKDLPALLSDFQGAGFTLITHNEKRRQVFSYKDSQIVIDTFANGITYVAINFEYNQQATTRDYVSELNSIRKEIFAALGNIQPLMHFDLDDLVALGNK